MKNQQMLSRTIGLQKVVFTNSLAIFSTMQQHGENLLKTTLEQSPWLPGSSKVACTYWADFSSEYLENLKSMADQGFAAIERVYSPSTKAEENEPQQTKDTKKIPASRPAKANSAIRKKTVSAKKTVEAKPLPGKKAVSVKAPADKPVASKKVEVEKAEDVKAVTSIPKASVIKESAAPQVSSDKESAVKSLPKKG